MLQQGLLQVTQFQYNFSQSLKPNDDTVPQTRVFASFLISFKIFQIQLSTIMGITDQSAYINFSQTFDEIDILPFIIGDDFKDSQNINLLQLHIAYFDIITFDNYFIV